MIFPSSGDRGDTMKYPHQKLPGLRLLTLLNPPTDSEEIRMSEEGVKGQAGSHARNPGLGAFPPQVQVKNEQSRERLREIQTSKENNLWISFGSWEFGH